MLNAQALLSAWEAGVPQSSLNRAVILLQASSPAAPLAEWRRMTIGERDSRLLDLREELFGRKLDAVTACPLCSEKVEFSFTTDDIRIDFNSVADPEQVWKDGEHEVTFKLPATEDLLAAATAAVADRRETLLHRCLQHATTQGSPVPPKSLPEAVIAKVIEAMAKSDPRAHVEIAVSCPECKHQWVVLFDIASWLWGEVEEWAGKLLRDVCKLAYSLGWSESDILAMSATRRRLYLEMLHG